MQLSTVDSIEGKVLLSALIQITSSIEKLIIIGMSSASNHTIMQFDQSFKKLSSMGLMRLGSNLRLLKQEIERYVNNQDSFSSRRLSFFLNRSWLMCQGLQDALQRQELTLWHSLSSAPVRETLPQLEVVTLGLSKKLVAGVFSAFEFRLRVLDPHHALFQKSLIFSLVFPLKEGQVIHPDAFLEFDQKQQYRPSKLLTHVMRFNDVQISHETDQRLRLSLTANSTVEVSQPIAEVPNLFSLAYRDEALLQQTLANYKPSPFDLEIDLQAEVLLKQWHIGDARKDPGFPERHVFDISASGQDYIALVSTSDEGAALLLALQQLASQPQRAPLFALMHYELGQRVLQPLSILLESGPQHLMLGQDKTDYKTLLEQLR